MLLAPLEFDFPYNIIWDCPPFFICPLLKFTAMYLPPLERNPEIKPEVHKCQLEAEGYSQTHLGRNISQKPA